MRLKLFEGKQRELILTAKGNKSWKHLAELTNHNHHYLATELRKEIRLLNDKLYYRLCSIAKKNFDQHIVA